MIRSCKFCKKEFKTYPSKIIIGRGKFCTPSCYWRSMKIPQYCKTCGKLFRDKSDKKLDFCSKECKMNGSFGESLRGSNHWNWHGGITTQNEKIRKSEEYGLWRIAVLMRDHYKCQICGDTKSKLNVDHIKPFSKYPELRLAIDNGRTLCVECHRKTDTWGFRLQKFVDGQPAK